MPYNFLKVRSQRTNENDLFDWHTRVMKRNALGRSTYTFLLLICEYECQMVLRCEVYIQEQAERRKEYQNGALKY